MASSSTALSKTAINTLRGVLFTTSFSVVLLAEERRRRIKIARAAVDNARKIHAAKASRSAEGCARLEPFDLEARLAGLEGEALLAQSGAPGNQYRQGRRKAVKKSNISGSSSSTTISTTSQPSQRPPSTQHIDTAFASITEAITSGRRLDEVPANRAAPLGKTAPDIWSVDEIAETEARARRLSTAWTLTMPKTEGGHAVAYASDVLEYEHIIVTPEDRKAASASYNDAVAALIAAAQALPKSSIPSDGPSQDFQKALLCLQHVGKHKRTQFSHRAIVQDIVVNLLKYSVDLTASEMTEVLKASRFLQKSLVTVLGRFLDWIEESRPAKAAQALMNILPFFENAEQVKLLGGHVAEKIIKAKRSRSNPLAVRQYEMLKLSGLFTNNMARQHEYFIRREAIIAACAAGRTQVVNEELTAVRQLQVKDTDTDFKLQAALMIQKVVLGARDTALDSLRDLEKYAESATEFQKHLGQLTNLFAKMYEVEDLGRWLQRAAETFGMVLRTEWAFTVVNDYAHRHDIEGMMLWIEYCLGHGLKMDYNFALAWQNTCRRHLRFGQEEAQALWMRMAKFMLPTHRGSYGAQYKSDKSGLKSRMAELTESGHWDKACRVFDASLSKSRDVCESSFQLALEAHVQANSGDAESAIRMLERARASGKDTANIQCQFLRREIRARPSDEIKSLLFMTADCGSQIPAEVYPFATEKVIDKDLYAAHDILQLGVKQLGHGKLAFNGYCFAKLLYINIALYRYDAVQSLLSEFVSGREVWHGSRLCKESMKFAIRELAKRSTERAADDDCDNSEHGVLKTELRLMDELQQALDHNSESRLGSGYHASIGDMMVQLVEEVAQREDVSAALEWQRNKRAAKAMKKAAKRPTEVPIPRQDRITHISVDV
ncbi:hypothetical protein PWT90_01328 [Aphanocladium album]|nr:hypothetical protein PWT90_01328 [Aphanocladium album]